MLTLVRTWGHSSASPACGAATAHGFDTAVGPAVVRWDSTRRKIKEFQVKQIIFFFCKYEIVALKT